jgi:DNA mismatch endonuclease (patch repair protein)
MKAPKPGTSTDSVSAAQRSRNMSHIRGTDTVPELQIRQALHALGFRYRLHAKDLPGKPDLVFPKYRSVVFVHGCFWHGHGCANFRWPRGNAEYWRAKISSNISRDQLNEQALQALGWRVLVVWECLLRGKTRKPISEVVGEIAEWLWSRQIPGVTSLGFTPKSAAVPP